MNNSGSGTKSKKQKALQNKKILEQLGELSSEVLGTATSEGKKIAQEAVTQILGTKNQEKQSGDIEPGGFVNVAEKLKAKNEKLEKKVFTQNNLIKEIQAESEKKLNSLRVRLQALMSEAVKMASSAGRLSEETKIATMQAPANPGEYHIAFVQNLIEYISSFRKKVDDAVSWLAESNKRAQKKNYWAMYKKKGASFLLSGESYNSRSAG